MILENLSYQIRGAIFKVHNELGPGLLESVYEAALAYELIDMGLKVTTQAPLPAYYREVQLSTGFRVDMVVDDKVIVEIKSTESIHPVHKKIVRNYLKLSKKELAILVNFNTDSITDNQSIFRIIN
jgi:GxxExxY protein